MELVKHCMNHPEVPNYGKRGKGIKLKEGLVIAIEPMINMGTKLFMQHNDGWTITTADGLNHLHILNIQL